MLTTTPHPNISEYSWSMPAGISQIWPSYSPAPVSDNNIIPSAANSNVTFEWNGVNIQAGVRFLRGNDAIRKIAVEMGCVLIDVENTGLMLLLNMVKRHYLTGPLKYRLFTLTF